MARLLGWAAKCFPKHSSKLADKGHEAASGGVQNGSGDASGVSQELRVDKTADYQIAIENVASDVDDATAVTVEGDTSEFSAAVWTANIRLEPFFKTGLPSPSGGRMEAKNAELEKATRKLQETLVKRERAGRGGQASFNHVDLVGAMQRAGTSPQCGEVFGAYVEGEVTRQRHLRGETTKGKLAQHAAKLYPVATVVLGLVSFGADAAAFLPVKIAANGLQQLLTVAMKEHERATEVVQLLDAMTDYGPFLDNLRELVNSSQLLERATDFLIAMTDFLRESLDYLDRSLPMRLVNDSWTDSRNALEDAGNRLDKQITRDMQVAFFNWMEQAANSRILSSISSDLSFRERQQHYWSQRMPDSGQWVLDDPKFQAWEGTNTKDTAKAEVLCCIGLPGVGKTFIASRIVAHLEDARQKEIFENPGAKIGVAYIYCNIADQEQQTALGFASSIARQLAESPVIRPSPLLREAETFHRQHLGRVVKLSDYVEFIQLLLRHLDRAFILVDALDECADYDKNQNSVLGSFVKTLLSLNVPLLFTTRRVGAVERLKQEATRRGFSLRELNISQPTGDIQNYIRWRIYDEDHGNRRLGDWISGGQLSESEVIGQVFSKYSGVFNLVRLQMDILQQLWSAGDVLEALHEPGKTEEQFYDKSLERIETGGSVGIGRHLGFRILGWVSRAKRPLSFDELQDALAMKAFATSKHRGTKSRDVYKLKEEDVLTACYGLIVVESTTRTVAFAHATVKEYLDETRLAKFPFHVDIELAETCLAYISQDVFAEGPCVDDESFASRIRQNPFYSYASQYWGQHVFGTLEMALKEEALEFLNRNDMVLSSLQAKCIEENHYKFKGRSRSYTKDVDGLWVTSLFGLHCIASALIENGANVNVRDDKGRTALMVASLEGHTSIVQLMLDANADVSVTDHHGRTALHWAAAASQLRVADILLGPGVGIDVNATDEDGSTALHYAAEEGQGAMVRKLIRNGADAKLKNHWGWSPLDSAAPAGYEEATDALLDGGADVNSTDYDGITALHWTAPAKHVGTVKSLLSREAKPDFGDGQGRTPLHHTAQGGTAEIMKLLLAKSDRVNPADRTGWTPLHAAALAGRVDIVQLLLGRGAETDAKDEDGWTPLHAASLRDHEAVVQVLLPVTRDGSAVVEWAKQQNAQQQTRVSMEELADEKEHYSQAASRSLEIICRGRIDRVRTLLTNGLDPNGETDNPQDTTPLGAAAGWNQVEVARLLLDNGADVNKLSGAQRDTALQIAVSQRNYSMVEMLLVQGADVNLSNKKGQTALSLAAECSMAEIADLLIAKGAEVDAKIRGGLTPLHAASRCGNLRVMTRLLEAGANIEAPDCNGLTPLMIAAQDGLVRTVQLLLGKGADKEAKDISGSTALSLATAGGYRRVVKLLRDDEDEEENALRA